eukprot:TRINITY_DN3645_c0_g1_i4.p1 TRINITY_DN3645_c0_g1~~TRINITY_DN3645_c0_g1_i4.p1  ORF type:complete len:373 (+),score=85.50 TRINITY_DN3645_c0_g1_i4:617-1735(+)
MRSSSSDKKGSKVVSQDDNEERRRSASSEKKGSKVVSQEETEEGRSMRRSRSADKKVSKIVSQDEEEGRGMRRSGGEKKNSKVVSQDDEEGRMRRSGSVDKKVSKVVSQDDMQRSGSADKKTPRLEDNDGRVRQSTSKPNVCEADEAEGARVLKTSKTNTNDFSSLSEENEETDSDTETEENKDASITISQNNSGVDTEPRGILRKPGEKRVAKAPIQVEQTDADTERTTETQKKRKHLKRQDTTYTPILQEEDSTPGAISRDKQKRNPMNKGALRGSAGTQSATLSAKNSEEFESKSAINTNPTNPTTPEATDNRSRSKSPKKFRVRSHSQAIPAKNSSMNRRARSSSFSNMDPKDKARPEGASESNCIIS